MEMDCGGENYICPKGSTAPLHVDAGYYTVRALGFQQLDIQTQLINAVHAVFIDHCSHGAMQARHFSS